MSVSKEDELTGMRRISGIVASTLREMMAYANPGMTTKQLDEYGGQLLTELGAKSAPYETYGFPGWTCISVNEVICHGVPSEQITLQEGDLVNIDVSAELDGFWSDNGCSFILGQDINKHQALVDSSRDILREAIAAVSHGVRVSHIGHIMESMAKERGYKVIRNLAGHGVGGSLHEEPSAILNYPDRFNPTCFKAGDIVAIETFITTDSDIAVTIDDDWSMIGDKGGFMAQHEHTIVVTQGDPIILTEGNGVW